MEQLEPGDPGHGLPWIGVDVGGSGIRVAAGRRLHGHRFHAAVAEATEQFLLDTLARVLRPYGRVKGVGIALPMTVVGTGERRRLLRQQSKFIPFSQSAETSLSEIERRWAGRLGVPVRVLNDAEAAAFDLVAREAPSAEESDSVVMTLGTSIGVAYALGRRVHLGPFSSRASHAAMDSAGPACPTCLKRGCWKMMVGAEARQALALALGLKQAEDGLALDVREIGLQARTGCGPAIEWMNTYASRLTQGLAQLLQFIPLQRVVLSGGIVRNCPGLVPRVRALWRSGAFLPKELSQEVRIVAMPALSPARGARHFARQLCHEVLSGAAER